MTRTAGRILVVAAFLTSAITSAQRQPPRPPPGAPPAAPVADEQEAQRQKARELLQQGNRLLDQGNYLEALRLFEQAYAAFPSPKLHFNIAQTLSELGRPLESLRHYEQFVRDVKREEMPQNWQLANERIFKLQSSIAVVMLQCNVVDAQVMLDGTVVGTTPIQQPLRVMPGHHVIIVEKPGYDRHVVELTAKAGDVVSPRVKLLTEAEGLATKRAFQEAEAQRLAALEQERRAKERLRRTRGLLRTSGWAALGTGVGLMVVGGVFGGLSVSERNKVEGAAPHTAWTSVSGHYQNADTYRKVLYAGVAAGGVVAIVGAALVGWTYRSAGAERSPAPKPNGTLTALPMASPQGAGFIIGGRF